MTDYCDDMNGLTSPSGNDDAATTTAAAQFTSRPAVGCVPLMLRGGGGQGGPDAGGSAGRAPLPAAAIRLRLTLIGRVDAWSLASQRVLPRTRKARALLAVLALGGPQPIARSRLAGLLWSRRGAEQARGSLRQALHELQEVLRPVGVPLLAATRTTVALDTEPIWLDVREVMRATPDRPEPLDLLDGGDLLADLDGLDAAFDLWLAEQRRRLRGGAVAIAVACGVARKVCTR